MTVLSYYLHAYNNVGNQALHQGSGLGAAHLWGTPLLISS
jgi:hypothetical protein